MLSELKSFSNLKITKNTFKDPIYGQLAFYGKALRIIETLEFQRLKEITQLGGARFFFHTANHTRFEHSLGVAHLVEILLDHLIMKSCKINGRLITEDDKELFIIAALCHDIGHGPFSHLFDRHFSGTVSSHETRSIHLIKEINIKYKIGLSCKNIDFITDLINGTNKRGFEYQILADKKNGLDLDRIDYLIRDTYYTFGCIHKGDKNALFLKNKFMKMIQSAYVCQNNLCYSDKHIGDIYSFYKLRVDRYHDIYFHPNVQGIELMISDMLDMMEIDMTQFITLDDHMIFNTQNKTILQMGHRIKLNQHYKLVHDKTYPFGANKKDVKNKIKDELKDFTNIRVVILKIGDTLNKSVRVYSDNKQSTKISLKYWNKVSGKDNTEKYMKLNKILDKKLMLRIFSTDSNFKKLHEFCIINTDKFASFFKS